MITGHETKQILPLVSKLVTLNSKMRSKDDLFPVLIKVRSI
jgi:hypothetical protein